MPNKEWYTKIDGKQQGPFSVEDLKLLSWLTPETLVRKEGEREWRPIGKVKELKKVFEDAEPEANKDIKEEIIFPKDSELILELEPTPPFFLFVWVLIVVLLSFYFMHQLSDL
ncbi:MAG: hypothetical protein ACI9S8_001171 [Chlamydiales bacterium]|jgi:hypothetical protein